ncbi:EamA family transporter [Janthinobacterium sp. SUN118]|uniref:DMT family transporter n=1 Tax=Janthinobacterium sp. SUN118 TaxID=3004100 RepID=UPI0025AF50B5|nr:EamA family transporter [Janthinobacterium sp. SUN118]MDN2708126.1 EamA family transporter [Janthinobacterium sp. SUN118]
MSSPLLFIIACLIWGSTFWAITLQLGDVAPAVSVVYRFGLASAALFAWCAVRGDALRLPWRAQKWMLLQGLASFALSYVCTYSSEQYLVSALVSVLFALMVFWTPLLNRIVFGTPITWSTCCAAFVAIAGIVLLFYQSIGAALQDIVGGGNGHFLLGFMLALVATVSSTVGNALVMKVREQSGNVMLTMAWTMLWGTLMVAVWAVATGQSWQLPARPSYWMGLFYLAIFGSVIAFSAYFTLIARIGTQKTVYIGVVTPVISVLLSVQFEHYRPAAIEWAGMVLCLSSVAWALTSGARKTATASAISTTPPAKAT